MLIFSIDDTKHSGVLLVYHGEQLHLKSDGLHPDDGATTGGRPVRLLSRPQWVGGRWPAANRRGLLRIG